MKLCNSVSKLKISDFKAGPQAWPKPSKFCLDYDHLRDCSDYLYDRYRLYSFQESLTYEILDSGADPEA